MRDRIIKRFLAKGEWLAETGLHVGGDDARSMADMALVRKPNGDFFIPAAGIAGVARHALAERILSYHAVRSDAADPLLIRRLFGDEYASLLTFFDAPAVNDAAGKGRARTVRDGVRIEPKTGMARDGAKFDYEVLPAGARFEFRVLLSLPEEIPGPLRDHKDKSPPEPLDGEEILGCFRWILEAFAQGEIRLGAKSRRGLGEGRVAVWQMREFDFSNRDHVLDWLAHNEDGGRPIDLQIGKAPSAAASTALDINVWLRLKTSLLIRKAGGELDDPDTTHLSENGYALLTGTSVAGVLRHRVERIARVFLSDDNDKLKRVLTSMFGTLHKASSSSNKDADLRVSRVRVSERRLSGGKHFVQSRVAIDRFTGGSKESALFDEAPYWPTENGPHAELRIRLDEPQDFEIGLLLGAFRDLWLGDLMIGGSAGIGRGVFEGVSADITIGGEPWRIEARPGGRLAITGDRTRLDRYVTGLNDSATHWKPYTWDEKDLHETNH